MGSRILNIHPCIEVVEGKLMATKKYRGKMLKVVSKVVQDFTAANNFNKEKLWLIWSIGLDEHVRKLAEQAAREHGFKDVEWVQTGCVITTHGGPRCFGLVGVNN